MSFKTDIQGDYAIFDGIETVTLTPGSGATPVTSAVMLVQTSERVRVRMAQEAQVELRADDLAVSLFASSLGGNDIQNEDGITRATTGKVYWVVSAKLMTLESRWDCLLRKRPNS